VICEDQTCDEGIAFLLRPHRYGCMGHLRHEQIYPVYFPALTPYLIPGSLEGRGAQVLVPEGARGRMATLPMDLVALSDSRWMDPCERSKEGHDRIKVGQDYSCRHCGIPYKFELIRSGAFTEAPVLAAKGEQITCSLGDKATVESLREGEELRYEWKLRQGLWQTYVERGEAGNGSRHAVNWAPDELQHASEVWADLGAMVEYPDWIVGGAAPPAYAWPKMLQSILQQVRETWAAHPAVVLDARALVQALMDRPMSRGRSGSTERDPLIDLPGELLRALRNEHEELDRPRPGVLVALPVEKTWDLDLERRSGLASGRALWQSGR